MCTVRVDTYVTVRCDSCGLLGELVERRPGWRLAGFTGWLFYGAEDTQLCPSCQRLEAGHPDPPSDPLRAAEGP
jgi:hypothetical protein